VRTRRGCRLEAPGGRPGRRADLGRDIGAHPSRWVANFY
jgi:hypothetical protein